MRHDIVFSSDGVTLRGWLYLPEIGFAPFPAVVMAHGFAFVKEQGLERYAEAFAAAGMATVVFDNRNLGASEGKPRQDIDPWQQARDYRSAITFAQGLPEREPKKLVVVPGDHYAAYVEKFSVFAAEATDWFVQFLT